MKNLGVSAAILNCSIELAQMDRLRPNGEYFPCHDHRNDRINQNLERSILGIVLLEGYSRLNTIEEFYACHEEMRSKVVSIVPLTD